MVVIDFVPEPSLYQKNSRQRHLLVATANAHKVRHQHWKRKTLDQDELTLKCPLHSLQSYDCRYKLKKRSAARRASVVQILESLQSVPRSQPSLSGYLSETYRGQSARQIAHLSDYYLSFWGPGYFWCPFIDDDDQRFYKGFLIEAFLNDGAFTEAVLAITQLCYDMEQEVTRGFEMSRATLRHLTRSLSLLRAKLDEPGSLGQMITFWTVLVITALTHKAGDWSNFKIHMVGMRQMMMMCGGIEAMSMKDPRGTAFSQQLEGMYTNYGTSRWYYRDGVRYTYTVINLGATIKECADFVRSEQISHALQTGGLLNLYIGGRLARDCTLLLFECVQYLSWCKGQHKGPCHALDGVRLVHKLSSIIERFNPWEEGYTLCLGMLILCISEQENANRERARSEEGVIKNLTRSFLDHWTTNSDKSYSNERDIAQDIYLLWTALALADTPNTLFASGDTRSSLLLHLVSTNPGFDWESAKPLMYRIYMHESLELRWKTCWDQAISDVH